MSWFHHPNLSWRVTGRRCQDALTDALAYYGDFILSRGRSAWRNHSYASPTSYLNAVNRLKRQGIVAFKRRHGRPPVLNVTPRRPADQTVLRPDRWWGERWHGVWYVLVYDIPEVRRSYRDQLRRILMHHRCGCLQESVWVSPRDIRPLFDDLSKAASLHFDAHLFEARSVLGRDHEEIVTRAWNFERIEAAHQRYQSDVEKSLQRLRAQAVSDSDITAAARDELMRFRLLIESDPLLPAKLHPVNYTGLRSYKLHRDWIQAVRKTGRVFRVSL